MTDVSLEQRQRVRSTEQVDKIKRELAEYDLAHSRDPIDRLRFEKEKEAQTQEVREAQQNRQTANWKAYIEQRIGAWFEDYFGAEENGRGHYSQAIAELIVVAGRERQKEFTTAIDEVKREYETRIAVLEARLKAMQSTPGRLPVVKSSWQPEPIVYQAELVCHKGSLYQAKRDTAQEPGRGADWICVSRHGRDAITTNPRGAYRTDETYVLLDIVEYGGSAWMAKGNYPGVPGHDAKWQLISKRGKQGRRGETVRGPQGEKGEKGAKGDDALEIINWHIDVVNYRAVPFMSNGKPGKELNLRPLFEHFLAEVSGAG